MTTIAAPNTVAIGPLPGLAEVVPQAYAGFWRRVVAFLIDAAIIQAALIGIYIALALTAPSLALLVDAPSVGLPSTERTLSTTAPVTTRDGHTSTTVSSRIVETKVLDRVAYVHRIKTTTVVRTSEEDGITRTDKTTTSRKERLDPETKAVYTDTWSTGAFYFIPWLIYMVLMERSAMQGTLGKFAMNIRVVDEAGNRMTFGRALVRNLLKYLSAAILLIGFMMAGWTQKKQALHDMMARAVVDVRPA